MCSPIIRARNKTVRCQYRCAKPLIIIVSLARNINSDKGLYYYLLQEIEDVLLWEVEV